MKQKFTFLAEIQDNGGVGGVGKLIVVGGVGTMSGYPGRQKSKTHTKKHLSQHQGANEERP